MSTVVVLLNGILTKEEVIFADLGAVVLAILSVFLEVFFPEVAPAEVGAGKASVFVTRMVTEGVSGVGGVGTGVFLVSMVVRFGPVKHGILEDAFDYLHFHVDAGDADRL